MKFTSVLPKMGVRGAVLLVFLFLFLLSVSIAVGVSSVIIGSGFSSDSRGTSDTSSGALKDCSEIGSILL